MRRWAPLAALAVLAGGCTTTASVTDRSSEPGETAASFRAVMADPIGNPVRDMIRTYVRDVAGPDYIVDADELLRSDTLTAKDRGRSTTLGPERLVPEREFRLEYLRDGGRSRCRLVSDRDGDPYLELPDSDVCAILPPVHIG